MLLQLKQLLTRIKGERPDAFFPPAVRNGDTLPQCIAVCNQKGGCGKTTTTINLAAGLAYRKFRSLIIDLDPQAHATLGLGLDLNGDSPTMHDVFQGLSGFDEVIRPTAMHGLYVAPANSLLSGSALELATQLDREFMLKKAIRQLRHWYDYILIDCSPSLNLLTLNALASVQHVLVPLQPHYFALEGMKELFQTIELVRERFNPALKLLGIVPVMVDGRMPVTRELVSQTLQYFGEQVLPASIRLSSNLVEAAIAGQPIMLFKSGSLASKDYLRLTDEIIRRLEPAPVFAARA